MSPGILSTSGKVLKILLAIALYSTYAIDVPPGETLHNIGSFSEDLFRFRRPIYESYVYENAEDQVVLPYQNNVDGKEADFGNLFQGIPIPPSYAYDRDQNYRVNDGSSGSLPHTNFVGEPISLNRVRRSSSSADQKEEGTSSFRKILLENFKSGGTFEPQYEIRSIRYKIIDGDPELMFRADADVVGNFAFLRIRTRRNADNVLNRERVSRYQLKVRSAFKVVPIFLADRNRYNTSGVLSDFGIRGDMNLAHTKSINSESSAQIMTLKDETVVQVDVLDANEMLPMFDPHTYGTVIDDATPIGRPLVKILARDADSLWNAKIKYMFTKSEIGFDIDAYSGELYLTRTPRHLPNFDNGTRYISIKAQDCGWPVKTSFKNAIVEVRYLKENLHLPSVSVNEIDINKFEEFRQKMNGSHFSLLGDKLMANLVIDDPQRLQNTFVGLFTQNSNAQPLALFRLEPSKEKECSQQVYQDGINSIVPYGYYYFHGSGSSTTKRTCPSPIITYHLIFSLGSLVANLKNLNMTALDLAPITQFIEKNSNFVLNEYGFELEIIVSKVGGRPWESVVRQNIHLENYNAFLTKRSKVSFEDGGLHTAHLSHVTPRNFLITKLTATLDGVRIDECPIFEYRIGAGNENALFYIHPVTGALFLVGNLAAHLAQKSTEEKSYSTHPYPHTFILVIEARMIASQNLDTNHALPLACRLFFGHFFKNVYYPHSRPPRPGFTTVKIRVVPEEPSGTTPVPPNGRLVPQRITAKILLESEPSVGSDTSYTIQVPSTIKLESHLTDGIHGPFTYDSTFLKIASSAANRNDFEDDADDTVHLRKALTTVAQTGLILVNKYYLTKFLADYRGRSSLYYHITEPYGKSIDGLYTQNLTVPFLYNECSAKYCSTKYLTLVLGLTVRSETYLNQNFSYGRDIPANVINRKCDAILTRNERSPRPIYDVYEDFITILYGREGVTLAPPTRQSSPNKYQFLTNHMGLKEFLRAYTGFLSFTFHTMADGTVHENPGLTIDTRTGILRYERDGIDLLQTNELRTRIVIIDTYRSQVLVFVDLTIHFRNGATENNVGSLPNYCESHTHDNHTYPTNPLMLTLLSRWNRFGLLRDWLVTTSDNEMVRVNIQVPEDCPEGSIVYKIPANQLTLYPGSTDRPDAIDLLDELLALDSTSTIFAVLAGNEKAHFSLDPSKGTLRLVRDLDYEAQSFYRLSLGVAVYLDTPNHAWGIDDKSLALRFTTTLDVYVVDVNDEIPFFVDEGGIPTDTYHFYLDISGAAAPTATLSTDQSSREPICPVLGPSLIGRIRAMDKDATDAFKAINYRIIDAGHEPTISVDPLNGNVYYDRPALNNPCSWTFDKWAKHVLQVRSSRMVFGIVAEDGNELTFEKSSQSRNMSYATSGTNPYRTIPNYATIVIHPYLIPPSQTFLSFPKSGGTIDSESSQNDDIYIPEDRGFGSQVGTTDSLDVPPDLPLYGVVGTLPRVASTPYILLNSLQSYLNTGLVLLRPKLNFDSDPFGGINKNIVCARTYSFYDTADGTVKTDGEATYGEVRPTRHKHRREKLAVATENEFVALDPLTGHLRLLDRPEGSKTGIPTLIKLRIRTSIMCGGWEEQEQIDGKIFKPNPYFGVRDVEAVRDIYLTFYPSIRHHRFARHFSETRTYENGSYYYDPSATPIQAFDISLMVPSTNRNKPRLVAVLKAIYPDQEALQGGSGHHGTDSRGYEVSLVYSFIFPTSEQVRQIFGHNNVISAVPPWKSLKLNESTGEIYTRDLAPYSATECNLLGHGHPITEARGSDQWILVRAIDNLNPTRSQSYPDTNQATIREASVPLHLLVGRGSGENRPSYPFSFYPCYKLKILENSPPYTPVLKVEASTTALLFPTPHPSAPCKFSPVSDTTNFVPNFGAISLSNYSLGRNDERGRISFALSGPDSKFFDINPVTGLITTSETVKVITLDREIKSTYSFTVLMKLNTGSRIVRKSKIYVDLEDANDNAPAFRKEYHTITVPISEYGKGAPILTAFASDKDTGLNGIVNYAFSNGSFQGPLDGPDHIEIKGTRFTLQQHTGRVYMDDVGAQDDDDTSYVLKIRAYDIVQPDFYRDATYIVRVSHNPSSPAHKQDMSPVYTISVPESTKVGQVIMPLDVHDADNDRIRYWISEDETDESAFETFAIDTDPSNVILIKPLDREGRYFYNLTLYATDGTYLTRSRLYINILDVNDNGPVFEKRLYQIQIYDTAPLSTTILTVQAMDPDIENNQLSYTIYSYYAPSSNKHFAINTLTGELYVDKSLDHVIASQHLLVIKVVDGSLNKPDFAHVLINVVRDLSLPIMVFEKERYTVDIMVDKPKNTPIVHLRLKNINTQITTPEASAKYSIESGNFQDIFRIDPNLGVIFVNRSQAKLFSHDRLLFKKYYQKLYQLVVVATSPLTNQTLDVTLVDINVIFPKSDKRCHKVGNCNKEFSNPIYYTIIDENLIPGSQLFAYDSYNWPNQIFDHTINRYGIASGDPNGTFYVDPYTGYLYLNIPIPTCEFADNIKDVEKLVSKKDDCDLHFTLIVIHNTSRADEKENVGRELNTLESNYSPNERSESVKFSPLIQRMAYTIKITVRRKPIKLHAYKTFLHSKDEIYFGKVYLGPTSYSSLKPSGNIVYRDAYNQTNNAGHEGSISQDRRPLILSLEGKQGGCSVSSSKLLEYSIDPIDYPSISPYFDVDPYSGILTYKRYTNTTDSSTAAKSPRFFRFGIIAKPIVTELPLGLSGEKVPYSFLSSACKMSIIIRIINDSNNFNPPPNIRAHGELRYNDVAKVETGADVRRLDKVIYLPAYPSTVVYSMIADRELIKDGWPISYYINNGSRSDTRFELDEKTGVITLNSFLNDTGPFVLGVGTKTLQKYDNVEIKFTGQRLDGFKNFKFQYPNYDIEIRENLLLYGMNLIKIKAIWSTETFPFLTTPTVTYELINDPKHLFKFEFGILKADGIRRFDREGKPYHLLVVQAYSTHMSSIYVAQALINISVTDENDNVPIFKEGFSTSPTYNQTSNGVRMLSCSIDVKITEEDNKVESILITKLTATDKDAAGPNSRLSYSILNSIPSTEPRFINYFKIDHTSGHLYLIPNKITESISLNNSVFVTNIIVQTSDGGNPPLSSELYLTISVVSPGASDAFLSSPSSFYHTYSFIRPYYHLFVPEDLPIHSIIATFAPNQTSLNLDSGFINDNVAYTIEKIWDGYRGDTDYEMFEIDFNKGQLSVASQLDYEQKETYHILIIKIMDTLSGNSIITNLTIQIEDVNDNYPTFEKTYYTVNVSENIEIGSFVIDVPANDADTGENGRIEYWLSCRHDKVPISEGCAGEQLPFYLPNPMSGEIYSSSLLDYEYKNVYEFVINAKDHGHKALSASAYVTVNIGDNNDNGPSFITSPKMIEISENIKTGQKIFQFFARDKDVISQPLLRYAIIADDSDDLFFLDRITGILSVVTLLENYIGVYHLNVTVFDGLYYGFTSLTIMVKPSIETNPNTASYETNHALYKDIDDTAKFNILYQKTQAKTLKFVKQFYIYENVTLGTYVGQVDIPPTLLHQNFHAMDQRFHFTLLNANKLDGRFRLKPHNGKIFVAGALNYTRRKVYKLSVLMVDKFSSLKLFESLSINIIDVPDERPNFISKYYDRSIALQTATTNQTILRLELAPKSDPSNVEFLIISPNSAERFLRIEPLTGKVRMKRNFLSSYQNLIGEGNQSLGNRVERGELLSQSPSGTHNIDFSFLVRARDKRNANLFSDVPVKIRVNEDQRSFTKVFEPFQNFQETHYFKISEGTKPGTIVGDLGFDEGTLGSEFVWRITYEIISGSDEQTNSLDTFSIDYRNGSISISNSVHNAKNLPVTNMGLDRESLDLYTFRVTIAITATDKSSSNVTFDEKLSTKIVIDVLDVNDNPPLFDCQPAADDASNLCQTVTVREDIKSDYPVPIFVTKATDLDIGTAADIRYSIMGTTINYNDGRSTHYGVADVGTENIFQIDPILGFVDVVPRILNTSAKDFTYLFDRERVISYDLNLSATDEMGLGLTSYSRLRIDIQDVNDNSPYFRDDQPFYDNDTNVFSIGVKEGPLKDNCLTTIHAIDPDINDSLNYFILSGNDEGNFIIDDRGRLCVTSTRGLDWENNPYYNLSIAVSDTVHIIRTKMVITVIDINDNVPTCPELIKSTIPEDIPVGSIIAMIDAHDADGTSVGKLTYSFENGPWDEYFEISESIGIIYSKVALDREKRSHFKFVVMVRDEGGMSCFAPIEPTISDVNDNTPIFDRNTFYFSISDSAKPGIPILQLQAHDADIGVNKALEYSLDLSENAYKKSGSEEKLPLHINDANGIISVDGNLSSYLNGRDYDIFKYNICAQDFGIPPLQSCAQIIFTILNSKLKNLVFEMAISEDSGIGTIVSSISSTMQISNQNGSYHIISGNEDDVFEIGNITGELVVRKKLNYRAQDRYNLVLEARDSKKSSVAKKGGDGVSFVIIILRINKSLTTRDVTTNECKLCDMVKRLDVEEPDAFIIQDDDVHYLSHHKNISAVLSNHNETTFSNLEKVLLVSDIMVDKKMITNGISVINKSESPQGGFKTILPETLDDKEVFTNSYKETTRLIYTTTPQYIHAYCYDSLNFPPGKFIGVLSSNEGFKSQSQINVSCLYASVLNEKIACDFNKLFDFVPNTSIIVSRISVNQGVYYINMSRTTGREIVVTRMVVSIVVVQSEDVSINSVILHLFPITIQQFYNKTREALFKILHQLFQIEDIMILGVHPIETSPQKNSSDILDGYANKRPRRDLGLVKSRHKNGLGILFSIKQPNGSYVPPAKIYTSFFSKRSIEVAKKELNVTHLMDYNVNRCSIDSCSGLGECVGRIMVNYDNEYTNEAASIYPSFKHDYVCVEGSSKCSNEPCNNVHQKVTPPPTELPAIHNSYSTKIIGFNSEIKDKCCRYVLDNSICHDTMPTDVRGLDKSPYPTTPQLLLLPVMGDIHKFLLHGKETLTGNKANHNFDDDIISLNGTSQDSYAKFTLKKWPTTTIYQNDPIGQMSFRASFHIKLYRKRGHVDNVLPSPIFSIIFGRQGHDANSTYRLCADVMDFRNSLQIRVTTSLTTTPIYVRSPMSTHSPEEEEAIVTMARLITVDAQNFSTSNNDNTTSEWYFVKIISEDLSKGKIELVSTSLSGRRRERYNQRGRIIPIPHALDDYNKNDTIDVIIGHGTDTYKQHPDYAGFSGCLANFEINGWKPFKRNGTNAHLANYRSSKYIKRRKLVNVDFVCKSNIDPNLSKRFYHRDANLCLSTYERYTQNVSMPWQSPKILESCLLPSNLGYNGYNEESCLGFCNLIKLKLCSSYKDTEDSKFCSYEEKTIPRNLFENSYCAYLILGNSSDFIPSIGNGETNNTDLIDSTSNVELHPISPTQMLESVKLFFCFPALALLLLTVLIVAVKCLCCASGNRKRSQKYCTSRKNSYRRSTCEAEIAKVSKGRFSDSRSKCIKKDSFRYGRLTLKYPLENEDTTKPSPNPSSTKCQLVRHSFIDQTTSLRRLEEAKSITGHETYDSLNCANCGSEKKLSPHLFTNPSIKKCKKGCDRRSFLFDVGAGWFGRRKRNGHKYKKCCKTISEDMPCHPGGSCRCNDCMPTPPLNNTIIRNVLSKPTRPLIPTKSLTLEMASLLACSNCNSYQNGTSPNCILTDPSSISKVTVPPAGNSAIALGETSICNSSIINYNQKRQHKHKRVPAESQGPNNRLLLDMTSNELKRISKLSNFEAETSPNSQDPFVQSFYDQAIPHIENNPKSDDNDPISSVHNLQRKISKMSNELQAALHGSKGIREENIFRPSPLPKHSKFRDQKEYKISNIERENSLRSNSLKPPLYQRNEIDSNYANEYRSRLVLSPSFESQNDHLPSLIVKQNGPEKKTRPLSFNQPERGHEQRLNTQPDRLDTLLSAPTIYNYEKDEYAFFQLLSLIHPRSSKPSKNSSSRNNTKRRDVSSIKYTPVSQLITKDNEMMYYTPEDDANQTDEEIALFQACSPEETFDEKMNRFVTTGTKFGSDEIDEGHSSIPVNCKANLMPSTSHSKPATTTVCEELMDSKATYNPNKSLEPTINSGTFTKSTRKFRSPYDSSFFRSLTSLETASNCNWTHDGDYFFDALANNLVVERNISDTTNRTYLGNPNTARDTRVSNLMNGENFGINTLFLPINNFQKETEISTSSRKRNHSESSASDFSTLSYRHNQNPSMQGRYLSTLSITSNLEVDVPSNMLEPIDYLTDIISNGSIISSDGESELILTGPSPCLLSDTVDGIISPIYFLSPRTSSEAVLSLPVQGGKNDKKTVNRKKIILQTQV